MKTLKNLNCRTGHAATLGIILLTGVMGLTACDRSAESPAPVGEPPASAVEQAASLGEVQTTVVTDENYSLAESEIIFSDYVKKIAEATSTNGMGVWLHLGEGPDPKDRTIMRINFDTLYSTAIVDLTEDAVLTMPETNGRYQSAWLITDEHYNPMAFVEPGTYTLTL